MSTKLTLKDFRFLFLLILALLFARISIGIYSPALPAMVKQLHTSIGATQITVMIYLLCVGLMQPVYGPISDAIGRRKVLLFGTLVFMAGSLVIAFATNIHTFIIGRVIQGVGAASSPLAVKSMACDYFEDKKLLTSVLSMIATCGTLFIALAPAVGGTIQHLFGWPAIFFSLAGLALIVEIFCLLRLKETNKNLKAISLKQITRDYKSLLTNKSFMFFLLSILFLYSCELLYLSMAPFIFQGHFKMQAVNYGYLILIPSLGFLSGIQLGVLMKKAIPANVIISIGLSCVLLSAIILIGVTLPHLANIANVIIAITIAMLGVGIAYNFLATEALYPTTHIAGSAVALLGLFQMGGSGLFSIILSHFQIHTGLGLGLCYLLVFIGSTTAFIVATLAKKKPSSFS